MKGSVKFYCVDSKRQTRGFVKRSHLPRSCIDIAGSVDRRDINFKINRSKELLNFRKTFSGNLFLQCSTEM